MYAAEEYYLMAKEIAGDIAPMFKRYHDSFLLTKKDLSTCLEEKMKDWTAKLSGNENFEKTKPCSFENFVWFVLSTCDEESASSKDLYAHFKELQRQRKKYLLEVIDGEKKDGYKKGYIHNGCEAYFNAVNTSGDISSSYDSEEEYRDVLYKKIQLWAKDQSTNMIDFPFIKAVRPSIQINGYICDVACQGFKINHEKYYGKKTTGTYVNIPTIIKDGVFSFIPGEDELEHDVQNDSVRAFSENVVQKEDGGETRYLTIMDEFQLPSKEAAYDKTEVIQKLVDEKKIKIRGVKLDTTDSAIFDYIYNHFSTQDLARGSKEIPLMSLVKEVYKGTPRIEKYKSVIEHLYRLSRYHVDIKTRNAAGDMLFASISFFDIIFRIPASKAAGAGESYVNLSISDSSPDNGLIEELAKEDMSSIIVDVQPSRQIKEMIKSDMISTNIRILTKQFAAITSSKTQTILALLQSERIDRAPEVACALKYSYFIDRLRLQGQRKNVIKKILKEQFDKLKEDAICIQEYELRQYDVFFRFLPLSADEQIMYQ